LTDLIGLDKQFVTTSCLSLRRLLCYTGWPKTASHYQESSLIILTTVSEARFFINFDYRMSTTIRLY